MLSPSRFKIASGTLKGTSFLRNSSFAFSSKASKQARVFSTETSVQSVTSKPDDSSSPVRISKKVSSSSSNPPTFKLDLSETMNIIKSHSNNLTQMRKKLGPSLVGKNNDLPVESAAMQSSLHYELMAYDDSIKTYYKDVHSAQKRGTPGTSMGPKLSSQWFPSLQASISEAQRRFLHSVTMDLRGHSRNAIPEEELQETKNMMEFGPYLCELNADKVASIVIQETLNICLSRRTNNVPVVRLATALGRTVYAQRNFDRMKKKYFGIGKGDARYVYKVNRIAENVEKLAAWDEKKSIMLGSFLIKKLLESAKVPQGGKEGGILVPAFVHEKLPFRTVFTRNKNLSRKFDVRKVGVISLSESLSNYINESHDQRILSTGSLRYLPMTDKPVEWMSFKSGGYKKLPVIMMRTRDEESRLQRYLIENASEFDDVCEGLNVLNSTKWTLHSKVFEVVEEVWARGGGICDIPSRADHSLPVQPTTEDDEEQRRYRIEKYKTRKENRNLHSLRCDLQLKLNVAREFDGKEFYFPHNIDFRGRAYPIPPHLNHVGGDLNRGLLQFAEGRKIGERGIYWLKIHLANVAGQDKLSLEDRITYVDNHVDEIMDSADDPMGGKRFWVSADSPWQTLAACYELTNCLRSPEPENFISRIPVQMDGSCNGLQHYAALGRDVLGALHVNLIPTEKPMDVYVGVLEIVKKYLKKDANNGHPLAKMLLGKVHRKTIKQTVMTTVYGVTLIGAKDQIKKQLKDHPDLPVDDDSFLHQCSMYLAQTTFKSLGEVFQSAQRIMAWLNECAYLMAADGKPVMWLTPLGLPIIQPYRSAHQGIVKTVLQDVSVVHELDSLPVNRLRQKSAFPPNYVHSLDASHMFLTAIECYKRGLSFASVHDSYWTHAADTDTLNDVIRDQFIKLHEQPLLESLYENFKSICPGVDFPPIPRRGALDLQRVRRSSYFFD